MLMCAWVVGAPRKGVVYVAFLESRFPLKNEVRPKKLRISRREIHLNAKRLGAMSGFAAIALSAAALTSAAPAFAGTSDCPTSYLCIWKDAHYVTAGAGSHLVKFQQYIPNYGTWDYSGTNYDANNSATSIYNHGVSETAYMYAEDYKDELLFSIPKGHSNGALWGSQGDNIESGYYYSFN